MQIKRGRNEFEEEMYEQGYERNKKTNSDKGSLLMKLLPNSIGLAKRQADRLAKVSMSDENKHQYVSCVGAQGGVPEAAIMLAAGLYKELKDLYNKLPSEEQRRRYHGVAEILKDSAKDLKNDLYGVAYGLGYKKEGDCDILLRKKIK